MWTLGADPEFFWPAPAAEFTRGTRTAPEYVKGGYALLDDQGVGEVHFRPVTSAQDFTAVCTATRALAQSRGPVLPHQCMVFPAMPPITLTMERNAHCAGAPAPEGALLDLDNGRHSVRFAGGHLHFGFSARDGLVTPVRAALLADLLIGIPMVPHDPQPARRKYFGRAGHFRKTQYGIEYRVLSNRWWLEPSLCTYVANLAENYLNILADMPADEMHQLMASISWPAVRKAIDKEDAVSAAKFTKVSQV